MNHNNIIDLLDKIHLGNSPEWLSKLPNDSIALTITSPPYYDNELYTLDNGQAEFGWRSYEEYLDHLNNVITEIYRVTIPSGRLILVLSNTSQTNSLNVVTSYWPIAHDVISQAVKNGWQMIDEAVWIKPKPTYPFKNTKSVPDTQLITYHEVITILRKLGKPRTGTNEKIKLSSVWKFDSKGPIKKYNSTYPSFPDELVQRCLKLWSLPNDIILDPYAGSGQVSRIALNMSRHTIGVETDSAWQSLWDDIS